MPDQGTIILYILSTLAQTCAALAALVGAVGLYYLQLLRASHTDNERSMRALVAASTLAYERAALMPVDDLIAHLDAEQGNTTAAPFTRERMRRAVAEWNGYSARVQAAIKVFVIFEVWNLLVVGVSLVGFNYIRVLASSGSGIVFCGLWVAAVGTVVVTVYSLYTWTREQRSQ